MQYVIITSVCYLTHYYTFSLNVAWFGAIGCALPRVTTRYRDIYKKNYINIWKKKDGNTLKIAQNQENLKENIR